MSSLAACPACHVRPCSRLEEALPDVFESLQEAYRGAEGRMAQELLRRYVLKVGWMVGWVWVCACVWGVGGWGGGRPGHATCTRSRSRTQGTGWPSGLE